MKTWMWKQLYLPSLRIDQKLLYGQNFLILVGNYQYGKFPYVLEKSFYSCEKSVLGVYKKICMKFLLQLRQTELLQLMCQMML